MKLDSKLDFKKNNKTFNLIDVKEKKSSAQTAGRCSNCLVATHSRRRQFSEQAWFFLLSWNEIIPSAVDQAICDECYSEMREILIDRNEEMEREMLLQRQDSINQSSEEAAS